MRPELRATQVKEAEDMLPALTLYLSEKYDLGNTQIPTHCVKVSFIKCLWVIARSRAIVLDVPEPLWIRFALKNLLIMSVWKLSRGFSTQRREVVSYAIENNSIENILWPNRRIPQAFVRLFAFLYGLAAYTLIDRIAFGSSGAKQLYSSLPFFEKLDSVLIEELPVAEFMPAPADGPQPLKHAVFVGALDDRKGILDLMSAWEHVEAVMPQVELKIIGDGPHSAAVSKWCLERPAGRRYLGFVEHADVGAHLLPGKVLVAPSRRKGRWREQIGLPIAEALSRGLTVVTTDETGLAQWLARNGHYVIPEETVNAALAGSIVRALQQPLSPASVVASLPTTAGRIAADHWLQTGKNTSWKDSR
ncbi:glycosyltransferase family 4 protein [Arthrobacter oryzae]|uniref:glycosyltransferase family 4 protein n=1 Tax=Arthrobacter oryzae TaxID=409290 RepID=UPI0030C98FC1